MVAPLTREEQRELLADMTRQAVDDGTYGKPAAWFEDPTPTTKENNGA